MALIRSKHLFLLLLVIGILFFAWRGFQKESSGREIVVEKPSSTQALELQIEKGSTVAPQRTVNSPLPAIPHKIEAKWIDFLASKGQMRLKDELLERATQYGASLVNLGEVMSKCKKPQGINPIWVNRAAKSLGNEFISGHRKEFSQVIAFQAINAQDLCQAQETEDAFEKEQQLQIAAKEILPLGQEFSAKLSGENAQQWSEFLKTLEKYSRQPSPLKTMLGTRNPVDLGSIDPRLIEFVSQEDEFQGLFDYVEAVRQLNERY